MPGVASDGNDYYHTYACEDWDRQAFYIFNTAYAENELGLKPCPEVPLRHGKGSSMEPKFSVDTTIDADIQYEASKSLMPRYVQLLTWVCFGLSVVLLGIMVWQYVMTKNTMHLVLALLLVLVVGYALFNQLRGPRTALRRWQQNIQTKYGSNALHLHTDFYDLTLARPCRRTARSSMPVIPPSRSCARRSICSSCTAAASSGTL